ncbi:virulence transcriptional regulator RovM, partial [Yersinia enterocolitica]
QFQPGESVPLVVMDEPSPFRDMAIEHLTRAGIAWRIAYVASSLSAIRAAVRAGLGITARPIEMMSPDLRVLGETEGLPRLPETHYSLCKDSRCSNELALAIFDAMQTGHQHGLQSGTDLMLDSDYLVDDQN